MYNQLQEHLNKYSILVEQQVGLDRILQQIKLYKS